MGKGPQAPVPGAVVPNATCEMPTGLVAKSELFLRRLDRLAIATTHLAVLLDRAKLLSRRAYWHRKVPLGGGPTFQSIKGEPTAGGASRIFLFPAEISG